MLGEVSNKMKATEKGEGQRKGWLQVVFCLLTNCLYCCAQVYPTNRYHELDQFMYHGDGFLSRWESGGFVNYTYRT
jgi:hypothetical protein